MTTRKNHVRLAHSGQQLGLVGLWWSAQEHRVRLGGDGLLLIGVIGEGKTSYVFHVDQPGRDRYYILCRDTTIAAPRLIRALVLRLLSGLVLLYMARVLLKGRVAAAFALPHQQKTAVPFA